LKQFVLIHLWALPIHLDLCKDALLIFDQFEDYALAEGNGPDAAWQASAEADSQNASSGEANSGSISFVSFLASLGVPHQQRLPEPRPE
jgi:hypothetical protein